MCFEGMEESGSEGLDDLISEEKDKFFKGVDCVCISGECSAISYFTATLRFSFLMPPAIDNYCVYPLSCEADSTVLRLCRTSGLNTSTPCLTYGLRGIAYFKISVSGPARDLHSGGSCFRIGRIIGVDV